MGDSIHPLPTLLTILSAVTVLLFTSSCGPQLRNDTCIEQHTGCTSSCGDVCNDPSLDVSEGLVDQNPYSGQCKNCLMGCRKLAEACEARLAE